MEILVYGTINSVALALYALGFALVYGITLIMIEHHQGNMPFRQHARIADWGQTNFL